MRLCVAILRLLSNWIYFKYQDRVKNSLFAFSIAYGNVIGPQGENQFDWNDHTSRVTNKFFVKLLDTHDRSIFLTLTR